MPRSAKRVAEDEAALRAEGLLPVEIWVRDTRDPAYQERLDGQLAVLRDSPEEAKLLKELDEFLDWDDGD